MLRSAHAKENRSDCLELYPVVVGSKETKRAFTTSETLPLTVIIDREGKIRDIVEGIMYGDQFAEKVKPLLGKAE